MKKTGWLRWAACALLAGAFAIAAPGDVHANFGNYVCYAYYYPPVTSSYGDGGAVSVTLWSAPSCTGSYQGTALFCSSGATSANCNLSYLHPEGALNTLMENLVRASLNDQLVDIYTDASNKPKYALFHAH
jgi:hypothetical protein